ncbi:hypothetical protein HYR69_11055, partial [Candidatus Sumerlaeota bacterium]|nr:hypothetical protein [Candidatus Sumerlaeota bacterium]
MTSVPLDLNMYLAALIFHGLWWWSTTYSKNLYRRMLAGDPANPRAGRSARRFRALSFAQVGAVYYFAVILWLINAAARQYLSLTPFEFSGHSTLQTLFLFVLPHAVSLLIYQRLSLRWAGQMSAADQPAGQSQASLLMWLPGVIGIGCFALGLMPPLLGRDFSRGAMTSWTLKWCLAGFVGAILFGKLLQRFGPTAAGRVLEMDETPLKDEILRIAALTGVKLRSIRIQTFRARSSAPRDINYIATQRAVWWNHFQVRR